MYIRLTHANFNTPIYIRTDEVLLAYHSKASACTNLVVKSLFTKEGGSSVWPVTESPEQIVEMIKTLEENIRVVSSSNISPEC